MRKEFDLRSRQRSQIAFTALLMSSCNARVPIAPHTQLGTAPAMKLSAELSADYFLNVALFPPRGKNHVLSKNVNLITPDCHAGRMPAFGATGSGDSTRQDPAFSD